MSRGSSKRPALAAFAMAGLCAVALVLVAGCAGQQPQPVISEAVFAVKLLDSPSPTWRPGVVGRTYGSGTGVSRIEILRDYYPECVTHEVRHVFEGAWHEWRATCR